MFRLYREPEGGELTVIFVDPADGGADYCAAVAKSRKHKDSFMYAHGRMESSQFGVEVFKMARYIHNRTKQWPLIAVERNNTGGTVISILENFNYPNMYREQIKQTDGSTKPGRIGWYSKESTRRDMLDAFALSLRQGENQIHDEDSLTECSTFVVHPSGKPAAANGAHDDLVICEAGAWQLLLITPNTSDDPAALEAHKAEAMFPKQDLFDEHGVVIPT